jgi:hypothetical protein
MPTPDVLALLPTPREPVRSPPASLSTSASCHDALLCVTSLVRREAPVVVIVEVKAEKPSKGGEDGRELAGVRKLKREREEVARLC